MLRPRRRCKICGRLCLDEETVKACEKQGSAHRFSVGKAVKVYYKYELMAPGFWLKGRVTEVKFDHNHKPHYKVRIRKDTAKKHGIKKVLLGEYSEDQAWIRAA